MSILEDTCTTIGNQVNVLSEEVNELEVRFCFRVTIVHCMSTWLRPVMCSIQIHVCVCVCVFVLSFVNFVFLFLFHMNRAV